MKKTFAICSLAMTLFTALPAMAASQEEGAGISGGDTASYTNHGAATQTSPQAKIDQKAKENGPAGHAEAASGSE